MKRVRMDGQIKRQVHLVRSDSLSGMVLSYFGLRGNGGGTTYIAAR